MKLTVALILCAQALDNVEGKAFLKQEGPLLVAAAAVARGDGSITVPPVSTTMQCVINLTIQYFIVYTSLAIVRTMNQVSKPDPPAPERSASPGRIGGMFSKKSPKTSTAEPTAKYAFAQEVLQAAALTVNYAPMLCVLFLGTRMRALQITQGEPDKYDLPQPWVKFAMQMCAWSVVIQTLMVLFTPILTGGKPKVDEDGTPTMEAEGATGYVLTFVRYGSMAAMYGGFTAVCAGAISMEAPDDGPYAGVAPPVSPAVQCTMNLCAQYFAVYLGIALLQTYHNFNGKHEGSTSAKLAGVLQMAVNTVNFAPMLCILFIGARMRALQLDPVNGNPQPWAQKCFYLCTYAVLVQLVLILTVPLMLKGELAKGETEGDVTFTGMSPTALMVMNVVRFAAMFALYGGFTTVIYSVCVIKAPSGPTPPVSPTMQCVMNLTVQYFFIYLMLWVLVTTKQFMSAGKFLDTAIFTLDSARMTVMFCPMLSVLFVGTRMRALQISKNAGSPPWWCQQAMFLCTYAVLLQVCMVLILPFFTGEKPKMDVDGNVEEPSGGSPALTYTVLGVRWLALLGLYGGATTVVCALFLMDEVNTVDARNGGLLPAPPGIPSL